MSKGRKGPCPGDVARVKKQIKNAQESSRTFKTAGQEDEEAKATGLAALAEKIKRLGRLGKL